MSKHRLIPLRHALQKDSTCVLLKSHSTQPYDFMFAFSISSLSEHSYESLLRRAVSVQSDLQHFWSISTDGENSIYIRVGANIAFTARYFCSVASEWPSVS